MVTREIWGGQTDTSCCLVRNECYFGEQLQDKCIYVCMQTVPFKIASLDLNEEKLSRCCYPVNFEIMVTSPLVRSQKNFGP